MLSALYFLRKKYSRRPLLVEASDHRFLCLYLIIGGSLENQARGVLHLKIHSQSFLPKKKLRKPHRDINKPIYAFKNP